MPRNRHLGLGAVLCGMLMCGCGKPVETSGEPAAPVEEENKAAHTPALAAANASLQAGDFETAATHLFQMRASGREFTTREASDYRNTLREAYNRALEAKQRGDPKADATLELLRAVNSGR